MLNNGEKKPPNPQKIKPLQKTEKVQKELGQ